MTDVTVENHGSIFLLRLNTEAAEDWVTDHVADDALYFGDALAVEPRYVDSIVMGMEGDGLEVE